MSRAQTHVHAHAPDGPVPVVDGRLGTDHYGERGEAVQPRRLLRYVCVCVCVYVCMYVCVYVCMVDLEQIIMVNEVKLFNREDCCGMCVCVCVCVCVAAEGFLSRYLSGHLSYVRRHITLNKMC